MDAIPKISIVIRAYNEAKHIEKLLVGIRAQTIQPHEIILVDSGSTDNTVSLAEKFGVRIVRILQHDFTFGRALNYGCAAARGDILVFVSAHVYPTHHTWLERLVAPFANPRVVLSYGRQRGGADNKFSEHQIFSRWFPDSSDLPQKSYFCNNANCAVRRTVWEQLPYDETLTGLEDLDWAKRAQAEGGWLAYAAYATIIHLHDETWAQVQNRYRREALALRQIDDHSRFSFLDFLRLLAINVYADSRAALRNRVLHKELGSVLRFRFHQLLGTWRGHTGPSETSDALRQRFYFPLGKGDRRDGVHDSGDKLIDYDRALAKAAAAPQPIALIVDNSPPEALKGRRASDLAKP